MGSDGVVIREKSLLISGCYRSGTTVLEKVLNQHPQVAVASQPFAPLYAVAKQKFLDQRNLQRRYPLGDLFLEDNYTSRDFREFLDGNVLEGDDIKECFDQMEEYRQGLWTPQVLDARGRIEPGVFWQVYQQLMSFLADLFPRQGLIYRGSKEVLVEEYAPYFAGQGAAVIIVVRDPRAMIASVNFRERDNQTGANRPILFSLRAWRKSVAIARGLAGSTNSVMVRYEDLAQSPAETLSRVARKMGISPFTEDLISGEIVDQYGKVWHGNSSFGEKKGISPRSVDSWRRKLPVRVVEYIETICLPEMTFLGYEPERVLGFQPEVVRDFRDPFPEIHAKFSSDYSHDPARVASEIERVQKLDEDLSPCEQRRWFLNEATYQSLRMCWPSVRKA